MSSAFQEKISAFVRSHILGKEAFFDSFPTPPLEVYRTFQEQGLANWWIASDLGGRGLTLEASVDAAIDLAYGDAGLSFTFFVSMIGSSLIQLYGTDDQKERYLGPMAQFGAFSATLGSEEEAGSELTRMTTTAVKKGAQYIVNGRKYFSTNAAFAEHLVVIASAPDDPRGYVALVLPRKTPGVTIKRRWKVNGLRSSGTYEVDFQNCAVAAVDALPGNGLRLLEIGLNPSRTMIAATGVGIGRRMRDACIEYAQKKSLKGDVLARNPVFIGKIGQMEMQLEAMRTVCLAAAREYDAIVRGPDAGAKLETIGSLKSTVVAKMLCGQLGWNIASVASEMFGGIGYTEDALIGKLTRDMRYISLIEGGDDVLREFLYLRHVVPNQRTA